MPTIVTRLGKGSPLTTAELDANLTNINAETVDNSGVFNLRPSLDIDLVGSKSVSPLVSFSRGSTGTYFDGKTTVKAEENLLTYSQDMNNWGKQLVSVVTNSTNTLAPDGTNTAEEITQNDIGSALIIQDLGTRYISGSSYTISAFIKNNNASYIFIGANTWDGAGQALIEFYLADSPIMSRTRIVGNWTIDYYSITPSTNGFYRLSMTFTVGTSTTTYTHRIHIGFSDGKSSIATDSQIQTVSGIGSKFYIWGAQLEQRSQPTAYIATSANKITNYIPVLQTASANVPRFNYDPITTELKGMLVEEQRTNLLSYSSDFDNAAWMKSASSVLSNVTVSPDGTLSADKIIESSGIVTPFIQQQILSKPTTNPTITIYVKYGGRNWIHIKIYPGSPNDFSNDAMAYFDIVNGVVGTVTRGIASITSVGNGWYRCSLTMTQLASSSSTTLYSLISTRTADNGGSYTGDGYSGVYIWGAQLEVGTTATSYIPTPLTYTGRNSTATYRGDNGYLTTAAINEARYERNAQGGRQLLLEGAANNVYTMSSSVRIGGDTQFDKNVYSSIAPDGTMSATEYVNKVNGSALSRSFTATTNTYTYSFYIKKGTGYSSSGNVVGYYNFSTGLDIGFVSVDLTTGAVGTSSGIIAYTTNAGNGWWRVVVTNTTGISVGNIFAIYFGYNGGASIVGTRTYLWGAQLETGSVATSYIPSIETFTSRASTATYFNSSGVLTTAATNVARNGYGYDSIRNQWVSQGLILEAAATNLLLNSNTQSGVYNASVTTNVVAPDGTTTGNTITAIAAGSVAYAGNYYASFTAGTTYTFSIFVKQGASRYVKVSSNSSSVFNCAATFDLQTGSLIVADSGANATIQYAGNGWYRLTASGASTVSGSQTVYAINATSGGSNLNAAAAGEIQLYSWGAQLETGSVATSYIPTTSAQVTRAADVYTSTAGSRAADVYSSSTVTRSADQLSINKTSNWFNSTNGTLSLSHDAASGQPLLGDGSSTIISSLGAGTVNIDYSNTQLSVVTQSGQANNTTGIFNFDTDLYIGGNSTSKINNHIKYLKFYPNNVINSTPDGSGLLLDTGFALLQEDGSVIFQE